MSARRLSAIAVASLFLMPIGHASAAPRPAAVQGDLVSLADALKDPDGKRRRNAVIGLAKLGTADAWAVLFERGLADRDPSVADEVLVRLAGATLDEALIDQIDSREGLRAKNEMVRLRVVEVLGRIDGAVPGALFERALKDKDGEVRAAAAHALDLRVQRGPAALAVADGKDSSKLVKALLRVAQKDRSDRARANAMAALESLTVLLGEQVDEAREIVADAARRGAPLVRAAATASSGSATVTELAELLQSSDRCLATTAVDLLADMASKDALRVLALRLGGPEASPLRPALRERIVVHLRRVSGLSHGPSAERWGRWVDGLDEDWRPQEGDAGVGGGDAEGRTTTFYGLRLVSDRVVFLVDMSGSMWDSRNGPRRKDSVDVELEAALRGLPPTARFDVVPYADTPAPWKGELVLASPRNVERAVGAFRGSGLRGKGDVWSALIPVLRDPEVDTVVILTDGAPTGGTRWNLALMRLLLADENRFRGVVLHAVLFDASSGLQRHWKNIAEDSGGVLRVID